VFVSLGLDDRLAGVARRVAFSGQTFCDFGARRSAQLKWIAPWPSQNRNSTTKKRNARHRLGTADPSSPRRRPACQSPIQAFCLSASKACGERMAIPPCSMSDRVGTRGLPFIVTVTPMQCGGNMHDCRPGKVSCCGLLRRAGSTSLSWPRPTRDEPADELASVVVDGHPASPRPCRCLRPVGRKSR